MASRLSGKRRASTYAIGDSAPRKSHSLPAKITSPQSALPRAPKREFMYDVNAFRSAGTIDAAAMSSQKGRELRVGSTGAEGMREVYAPAGVHAALCSRRPTA